MHNRYRLALLFALTTGIAGSACTSFDSTDTPASSAGGQGGASGVAAGNGGTSGAGKGGSSGTSGQGGMSAGSAGSAGGGGSSDGGGGGSGSAGAAGSGAGQGGTNASAGNGGTEAGGGSAGAGAGGAPGGQGGSAGTNEAGQAGSGAGEAGQGGSAGTGIAGQGGAGGQPSTFSPYFADNFESYSDGDSLSNNKPFDAAGRTVATTAQAHSGKQSAKMAIKEGDGGGFGQWGGILPINPALSKGQEVWVRLYARWPSSFQFNASPWMKFLRLHSKNADGSNDGYNDLYVDHADETTSVLRTIKEIHNIWAVYDGPKLPRDTWERYEMYLFIDDVPVEKGGNGRVRIWRDDALIFDRTDVPTITKPDGAIDYFFLFTYWNNEQPPNNECYIDDLVIATSASPPPNKDGKGNARIGAWVIP